MFYGLDFVWHWSPITLAGLILACLLYIFAIRWGRRDKPEEKPIQTRRVLAFFAAIVIVALLLLTPVDSIARTQLFLAHMFQAVTLITICAPLLLYAFPAWLVQPLFANPFVRPIARVLTQPVIASLLFNMTFLLWHMPLFFNFALKNGTFYHVMMVSFLLTSLLNWWPLIGPVRELHRMSYPQQMLYAFLDGQPVDVFAFLLVFSFVVLYHHYAVPSQLGISAFADQAAGGALLLLPGLVDLCVMTPLFFRWLGQLEVKAKIADQRRQEEEEAFMEEDIEEHLQAQ
ncbi:MAG TPA: cytochrome c oxidase assembly protein [Ktedonobacteraceae bacterium]|nr:cytochrome c oxidase assembly protein [Ktedonobacteraceae bacterium]